MMEQAIDSIYNLDPEKLVLDIITKLDKSVVEGGELEGLNLLHHCILSSNAAVARILLMRGYFQASEKEQNIPFLHLACLTGKSQLVSTLLEHGPKNEQTTTVEGLSWINLPVIIKYLRRAYTPPESIAKLEKLWNDWSSCEKYVLTALDTAALARNLNCVKTLLCFTKVDSHILERVVELGSSHALDLLLHGEVFDQENINAAFKTALRRKLSACLDILLKKGVEVSKVLNRLNPYHVLFMYSSAYQHYRSQNRNKGLDECTGILTQHGLNVNETEPLGSYPLFSAIHSIITEKDQVPNKIPIYNINSMSILLVNGADPNFDEQLYFQKKSGNDNYSVTLGRDLFSSALNALFTMLQNSDTWVPHICEHIDRCCLSLLEYGANPNYIDSCGDTPLHDLVKALATQHAMGHMNVDFSSMIRMLLFHGANPCLTSTNGLFPVHYYFLILVNLMGGRIAYTRWKQAENASQVLQLLHFMNIHDAAEAGMKILNVLEALSETEEEIPASVIAYVKDLIHEYVLKPKSLQELCKLTIWSAVGRKKELLKKLYLPRSLIYSIMDMFILDLDI